VQRKHNEIARTSGCGNGRPVTGGSGASWRADAFRSTIGPPRNTTIAPEKICISTQSDTGAQGSIWPSVGNLRALNIEVSLS
jgi:hypothetical protein